jgi:erythronate-4-phosphate dehydrogenase
MLKIIADDKIPFLKGVLEPFAEVIYLPGKQITREVTHDADVLLIRTRTKCTKELLEGSKVSFIGTATIGYDHIDTDYCEKNNLKWTNAPGCNSSSVQQYVTASLFKMASESGFSLPDKTIGIVGVGNVGSKVEKIARLLGMNVLICDPPRARKEGSGKFVPLGTILHEADIITVHVPLSFTGKDKTFHLFNDLSFKKMKHGAWFINSSRGEVTNTPALKEALLSRKLSGAVVDVWENEPEIDIELLNLAFLATPHIAGYSTDGKANGTAMIVNSLSRYFNLPLTDWYPADVPVPDNTFIEINAGRKTEQEIIKEAVLHTYDISADDKRFRSCPSDFERQRGDYPLRREFSSYTVKLNSPTEEAMKILEGLGFKIESKS